MKPASVMIVENNPDVRNTLRHAFADRGYLTWTCPAAEVAVSIFSAIQPHVVLIDLDFVGERGLGMIEAWKNESPHTRVIVQSQTADAGRMRAVMAHGAAAYLVKPFTLAPLFEMLENEIPPHQQAA